MTKSEYFETKVKCKKLKSQVQDFELGFKPFDEEKLYDIWKKYQALPEPQKQAVRAQWDEYYEAVRGGYFGQKAREASQLMKSGQTEKLKELVAEVKYTDNKLKTPSSIDPEELERKMWPYFNGLSTIKKWEDLLEQYGPLYESKRSLQSMDL